MAALRVLLLLLLGFGLGGPAWACDGAPTSSLAQDLASVMDGADRQKPRGARKAEIKPGGGELKPGGGELKPGGGELKPKPLPGSFRAVTQGDTPKAADAPKTLTIPSALQTGLQDSWDDSLPKPNKAAEHGGILVTDGDGKVTWRRGTSQAAGWFETNYDDAKAGETILADVHTHPYTKKEGGFTGVAFSGGDYGAMLYQDHRLSLVQSGDTVYAVATTSEWEAKTSGLDDREREDLYNEIQATWDANFDGSDFVADAEHAAKITASKYGLVLYKGAAGGTLKRIN